MPPLHDWRCPTGHTFEANVGHGVNWLYCQYCKGTAEKVFLKAPVAFVQQSVHYTSPVDGRPITSYQEHLEELARTDSVVYEPGIRQDQERNERRRDADLERSVDETVEREIATMPAVKREKLAAELEGGISAEPVNISAPYKPIVTKVENKNG